jgi:hypothetical protein
MNRLQVAFDFTFCFNLRRYNKVGPKRTRAARAGGSMYDLK